MSETNEMHDESEATADLGELLLRPMKDAPRDETYIIVYGDKFDGGAAIVNWDTDCNWWYLDDGKNPEIPMRGNEENLKGWLPIPKPKVLVGKIGAQ